MLSIYKHIKKRFKKATQRAGLALLIPKLEKGWENLKFYWMQIAIIIGCLYIVIEKDIEIKLHFSNPVHSEENQKEDDLEDGQSVVRVSENKEQFSIIDPATIQAILASAKRIGETKVEKKEGRDKEPTTKAISDYPNLLFVLNPDYAKRKNVNPEIIKNKIDICQNYIKRFAPIAIVERNKYGIPASIKIAQGLLETDAGKSRLSAKHNNHFGIKCFSTKCAKGHCTNLTDDSHKDFFRNFPTSWDSYRGHSLLLQKKRYRHLQEIPVSDYKNWAKGLKAAGYATDKKYAEKLILIIEFFGLDQLDI